MSKTANPTRSQPTSAQASGQALLWGVALGLFVGCGRQGDASAHIEPPPQRPLRTMNSAIRRGQWQEAWKLSDAVLATHGDDAEAIAAVARVAHENNKPDAVAELLIRACRAESFRNESRVQQALVAMIGVGRFYEGIEMLEEAIAAQPLQNATRRLLYDLYMGSENRKAGIPHGRILVRQRQFDLDLLLTLSNAERRTQDPKPLEEMTSRNPDDRRPLLGEAKSKFDHGDFEQSIQTLRSITQVHNDYLPAQVLLGRALAESGQFDELEKWSRAQTEPMEAHPGYWIALGDWARSKQQPAAAARAYWEATRRDLDVMESWSKLSTTLKQLQSAGSEFPDQMLASIEKRTTLLSTFNQLKSRFERTGSISRATAIDIVNTLRDLGRLWEAEAWASIAMTLPEDDAVSATQVRESIVAKLRKETPWQSTAQYPEFQLDLTNMPLPAISPLSDPDRSRSMQAGSNSEAYAGHLRLLNEASERGLTFHGRTDDHLDQAGIMLYKTLGCGGGTIDYDLDGWSDLYLVAAGGTPPNRDSEPNQLVRNLGGTFSNVTANSATGDTGFGQGVAVGDVNADGFPDLLVLNYGANSLLVNNGDGTFTDSSPITHVNPITNENTGQGDWASDWSTSGAIADLDGDGLSDLVVVNYCAGLKPVTTPCPMKDSDIARSCTPMMFAAQRDVFLKSSPEGMFLDQTDDWNAKPNVLGRGLGVSVGSFDNLPGIDVLIANDMTNNHYWSGTSSDDGFRLSESAMPRGLGGDGRALAQGSMGIATADLDRDGDIDFYVTNFNHEYNTYHEQRTDGIWQDQTIRLKLSTPTLPLVGFGTEAVDLDNDGTLELVVSNGHVEIFSRGDEHSLYAQPMQLFRRNESGTFDSIGGTLSGEYVSTPHVGRALWTLDANRDSLTDIAITHQTEPTALLINHCEDGGRWIAVSLRGRSCSRDAIGAIVEVAAGDHHWSAALTSGDGYLCSNERLLRFGLGNATADCDLTVTWPDGTRQIYRDLDANEDWLLVQSDQEAFRRE